MKETKERKRILYYFPNKKVLGTNIKRGNSIMDDDLLGRKNRNKKESKKKSKKHTKKNSKKKLNENHLDLKKIFFEVLIWNLVCDKRYYHE